MKLNTVKTTFFILLASSGYLHAADWTNAAINPFPTPIPDHIILNCTTDPAHTMAVTWRTDTSVPEARAEIAVADASFNYIFYAETFPAKTELLKNGDYAAHYHSVIFENLKPNTLYAYRVGAADTWSEWFQFRTAADHAEPFTFLYLGDGQNAILSLWSRAIRAAYSAAPESRLIIHGGDIVNVADSYTEWSEWHTAAGWINGMIPSVPVPGNHEYYHGPGRDHYLTDFWFANFTVPENGIPALPESNYFFDYQGVRFIILNGNEKIEDQAVWLKSVLKNNPNRWTVAAFHQTIYAATNNRDHIEIRENWKPLFDQYHVDLVLMGHDHAYARGHNVDPKTKIKDPFTGPVYVVSVSGPKFYHANQDRWMDRAGENTQLYQIIRIDEDILHYQSYTVTGELYDEFEIQKQSRGPNLFIDKQDRAIPERTFRNSLKSPTDK